jgi:CRP-like cAMP-binding protein
LIDRIRHDIQERLEQLLAEADKLRRALAALDPREKSTPNKTANPAPAGAGRSARAGAPARAARSTQPREPTASAGNAGSRPPAASGATKAKVLAALSSDGGMTAGDVASATGLGRGTVSTTLSKLAKSGEIAKAQRGYRLPTAIEPSVIEEDSADVT